MSTASWRRLVVGVAAIGATAVVAFSLQSVVASSAPSGDGSTRAESAASGETVPDLALEDLRAPQRVISLRDLIGEPLVVNFFASWCAPCRREMPAFQAVADEFGRRVTIVGVDNQDIRRDGLALAREASVRYPIAFDQSGQAAADFAVRGMPTTVFISRRGEILERVTGAMTERDLRATLRRLFGI